MEAEEEDRIVEADAVLADLRRACQDKGALATRNPALAAQIRVRAAGLEKLLAVASRTLDGEVATERAQTFQEWVAHWSGRRGEAWALTRDGRLWYRAAINGTWEVVKGACSVQEAEALLRERGVSQRRGTAA